LRVKQDAVPGMKIPVWFRAMKIGEYDIPCAELCGWGHYKMKGRLVVQSRADFEKYLAELKTRQDAVAPPGAAPQTADSAPGKPASAETTAPAEITTPLANTNR
jgi:cytochrome c oxidase subunit 2